MGRSTIGIILGALDVDGGCHFSSRECFCVAFDSVSTELSLIKCGLHNGILHGQHHCGAVAVDCGGYCRNRVYLCMTVAVLSASIAENWVSIAIAIATIMFVFERLPNR
jgi:hypothetical protein